MSVRTLSEGISKNIRDSGLCFQSHLTTALFHIDCVIKVAKKLHCSLAADALNNFHSAYYVILLTITGEKKKKEKKKIFALLRKRGS